MRFVSFVRSRRFHIHHVIDPSPKYVTVFAVNEDGSYAMTDVKVTREIQQVQPV